MAAPNIVNVTAIYGKTAVMAVTTSATAIVTNSAASGKVFKVNSLLISNVSSNNVLVTADLFRSSVAYEFAYQISIPIGATLDILSKSLYLEEGDSLRLLSSAAASMKAVCSFEEIN